MRNFILAFLSTLLVIVATPPTHKTVNEQPQNVKKQSIIQPLQPTVYAQKQELVKVPVAPPKPAPVAPATGTWVEKCHAWAAQAGVSLDTAAIKLLERESHCSPTVRNPNSSAGGIPQALPWTKMGCELSEAGAPCQIKWFQGYVLARYGSYTNALAHSYSKGWY